MYWFWSQLMSVKENCQVHDSSKSTQVHPSHNPTQNKVQNLDKKHWRLISCNKNTNRFCAHFWIKTLYPICDLWCFFMKSWWWLRRLPRGTPTQDCIVLLPSQVAVPAVLGHGQKTNKQTKMLCGFRADGRTQNFKVT